VLPGSKKTSIFPIVPAVARDKIARGPISSHERRRKASPKPSSVLSSFAATASYVTSRGAMPVPPVKTIASMFSRCAPAMTS
jgi:hypothetical protein